jgi:hypothetical protein
MTVTVTSAWAGPFQRMALRSLTISQIICNFENSKNGKLSIGITAKGA